MEATLFGREVQSELIRNGIGDLLEIVGYLLVLVISVLMNLQKRGLFIDC